MSSKLREVERERTAADLEAPPPVATAPLEQLAPPPQPAMAVPVHFSNYHNESTANGNTVVQQSATATATGTATAASVSSSTIVNESHHLYERTSHHDDVDNAFGDSPSSSKGKQLCRND